MSSTHETLFSLELVIDYVRFDCARGNVLDPAVGLRFLDFPTLLIYPSGREGPSSHSAYADLPAEALSQSEERDKYFFHKGKSCLFKINLDSLHNHLSSTPLYAMALNIKDEVPKLIGSSLISLAKVTERIKKDVDKHGIGTPSSYGEKIISPLCNLMGNNIGAISLAYKIVSLGSHLIPHIPYNKVYKVGKGEQDPNAFAESAGVFNIDRHPIEMQHATVLSSVSPEGQPENKMRSDAKQPGIAAFTQTEPTKQKVTWSEMSYGNDEQDNTTFCPPPLFYSSTVKKQQESDAETCRMSNVEIESLNIEDPEDKNNELESADMNDVNKITAAKHRSTLVSSPKQQHRITEPAPSGDVIRQLPLLNALLNELSLLNGQTQHQQPVSVHPNLVWLYTSAPEPHPLSAPGAKPKSEYQKRVAASLQSPQQRRGQSKMKGCIISPVSNSARKAGSAKKHQEKLQPKRKLKYGLTNTFRLRLQHVKIAHTKHHQCIEYEDMQQVKPQRQTLSDRKHAGKSARRGVNSDETIETLINSFEVNTTAAETKSSKLQTKPTKNMTSMPKDEATEPTRKVRVHVPSVLSHYSDRSGRRSVSSVQSVHHGSNKTNSDLQIFSETGRADSRSSYRKILTSSSEQEYQDDFTSLDATDGFSPEPLSSPEPNQHQRNRVSSEHSNSDDGSNISKGLPVPVKADNSPHRSLKCTHVIRPRPQTSALSLSSDEDEDGSNSGHHRSGSQISGRKTTSVRRTFGRSENCDADPADESMTLSRVSVDSVVATNNSVLKSFSPVEQMEAREEKDELGSLGLDRNYHHVSELMINKLPGYTL